GMSFPAVAFQNADEYNLSHPLEQSSQETFFCRPLEPGELAADTQTCATSFVGTDKGKLTSGTSLYPPRADITAHEFDDPSVATYNQLNPFDAVSQATPTGGMDFSTSWPIPPDLAAG